MKKIFSLGAITTALAYLLSLSFALAFSLININRLWQYELGYYDFGMFAVPIWKISRLQPPIIDHILVSGKINFADHFNPSIFLLSPLHWFTSKLEILLIAQSILLGASGIALFIIAKKLLKNSFLALAVLVSYFSFTGLQNAAYSDLHELTIAAFFLMMTYWCVFTGRKKSYLLFLIVTLGFKESLFQLGLGLSIFLFFYNPNWRRIAIFTAVYSLIYGYAAMSVIKFLNGGHYYYAYETSPQKILNNLIFPTIKLKTLFWSFASFSGLPLFTPSLWPLYIFHYAHRFLTEGSTRWDLGLHYNAEVAPSLAIGTVLGLKKIQTKISAKLIQLSGIIIIGIGLFLYRVIFHGPLGLAYNMAFYGHTNDFVFLDKLIENVPEQGSVAAQNNLTPSFFHREIYILRDNYNLHDPDLIVIDARDGQNPNNYLGIKDIKKLVDKIKADKKYRTLYEEGDQYIFKKN